MEAEQAVEAPASASEPAHSSTTTTTRTLTEEQTRALFDILTHRETYAEIEGFKAPDAVTGYGRPFARTMLKQTASAVGTPKAGTPRSRTPVSFWRARRGVDNDTKSEADADGGDEADSSDSDDEAGGKESTSPLLQFMLTRLVLPLPGVRDLPAGFWNVRVQGLLARFAEAELSESYDKGAMGTRKTLATGASSVLEMVARGILGGVVRTAGSEEEKKMKQGEYDETKAEDLLRAFGDVLEDWAYGDLMGRVSEHVTETEDVESFSPAVKAAMNYAIINVATFAHHTFTVSPEGQDLLKLIENLNSLVPYKMIKQTLRIGNAATMISGMMRLMLAKISVTSLTNWVGLTANADDGMNLLQRIISLALSWDASEFKKSVDKIEKSKGDAAPTDEMLEAIRLHVSLPRSEHLAVREASVRDSESIIVAILKASDPQMVEGLTEAQHAQCLEYYAALLSVHDREAITSVLCRQPPDLFTQAVKDVVGAYEPMIRDVHSQIDIRYYLEAIQGFVSELIRVSRQKKVKRSSKKKDDDGSSKEEEEEEADGASVEDYVVLLRNHRGLLYKWLHDFAKNCPDVWKDFPAWGQDIAVRFRKPDRHGDGMGEKKGMEEQLDEMVGGLDGAVREDVLRAVDKHAEYLAAITRVSQRRLQAVIDAAGSSSSTSAASGSRTTASGPGIYLSQWQSLLDSTIITPSSKEGPLRHGEDVKYVTTMGKLGLGGRRLKGGKGVGEEELKAPDVSVVEEALGDAFRDVIRQRAGSDAEV
ncbi:PX-associated domain-containing protein [Trichoderma breve]|uniref:PX-associated domain-containing protein n=1 Tax=Trichoderma breve TaxID=2034170 RepID=A0A9W9E357_9HYPO|nr:PX-associated domain-containing protein [Trichoderma breve]KAJ4855275.1 PX-associated domain-containing protein [Trichoderma breve]